MTLQVPPWSSRKRLQVEEDRGISDRDQMVEYNMGTQTSEAKKTRRKSALRAYSFGDQKRFVPPKVPEPRTHATLVYH